MDPPGLARGQFLLSESQYVSLCVVYVAEESKVRTEDPKCLNKRGATQVARFLHWIFKEQVCPQSGESSLLRWFWCFIGLSQAVADCISCHRGGGDRKSTRLNSSHRCISYAVFCLKKKKNRHPTQS